MATSRAFAYNTGSSISGTLQIGDLAISASNQDYSSNPGGIKWWQGADEDLGYVIAYSQPDGLHPTPTDVLASLGFKRSALKTEASFIVLANQVAGQIFASGDNAKTWLNANGYWTSWGGGGGGITLYAQLNANQACGFNGGYAIPTYTYTGTNTFCDCTALNGVNVGVIPDGTYWVADGNGNKRQFTKLASSGNTLLVAAGICSLC
jgi:hypothetical protein